MASPMASPTEWKAAAAVAAAERGMGSAVIGVREDLGAPFTERAPDPRRAVESALSRC
jgi:hypothetical protein